MRGEKIEHFGDAVTALCCDHERALEGKQFVCLLGEPEQSLALHEIDLIQDEDFLVRDLCELLENRARLMLEVTDAVVSVWGPGRVGMHLAPRGDAHDMGDSDLRATFEFVAHELGRRKIAFLCTRESLAGNRLSPSLRKIFAGSFVANEGFTRESAEAALERGDADAVAFGKLFLANPDLPRRFEANAPLNRWNSATFYSDSAEGYTDYPSLTAAAEPVEVR